MDSRLRELERAARQSGDSDDMYRFFCAYRRLHPKKDQRIPIEKEGDPRFYNVPLNIDGVTWGGANIEVRTWQNLLSIDIDAPMTHGKAFLDWLLGTTHLAMSEGPPRDVLEYAAEVSDNRWNNNNNNNNKLKIHIYLMWNEDYQLSYHRSPWDGKDNLCVGFIYLFKSGDKPSPIFLPEDEAALNKNFMPWINEWWNANYTTILEWQKLSTEHLIGYYEEQLETQLQQARATELSIQETKIKLAEKAFYQMRLAVGDF